MRISAHLRASRCASSCPSPWATPTSASSPRPMDATLSPLTVTLALLTRCITTLMPPVYSRLPSRSPHQVGGRRKEAGSLEAPPSFSFPLSVFPVPVLGSPSPNRKAAPFGTAGVIPEQALSPLSQPPPWACCRFRRTDCGLIPTKCWIRYRYPTPSGYRCYRSPAP